jgi:hypothetical protein
MTMQLSFLHRERIGQRRVSTEQIVEAYKTTGSVWKAGKQLGIIGQSVWERLKLVGYPLPGRHWTREEKLELTALISHCTLSEIALRLGRPYYGVAMMASRMGIVCNTGNKIRRKVPRGIGLNKQTTHGIIGEIEMIQVSLRQFCRARGFSIDSLALAIQKYEPDWWKKESRLRGFSAKTCPNCKNEFYPMTPKQKTCTRRCARHHIKNFEYFAGHRNDAVGLKEGICQLCLRERSKGLAVHHVLGKENDPEGRVLVALCPGCHQIVGRLAAMNLSDSEEGWQRLIELAMARRLAEKGWPVYRHVRLCRSRIPDATTMHRPRSLT